MPDAPAPRVPLYQGAREQTAICNNSPEGTVRYRGVPAFTPEDARLFAAAPDLYEALKEAEEYLHLWMEQNTGERELAALERIEKALAKADGVAR